MITKLKNTSGVLKNLHLGNLTPKNLNIITHKGFHSHLSFENTLQKHKRSFHKLFFSQQYHTQNQPAQELALDLNQEALGSESRRNYLSPLLSPLPSLLLMDFQARSLSKQPTHLSLFPNQVFKTQEQDLFMRTHSPGIGFDIELSKEESGDTLGSLLKIPSGESREKEEAKEFKFDSEESIFVIPRIAYQQDKVLSLQSPSKKKKGFKEFQKKDTVNLITCQEDLKMTQENTTMMDESKTEEDKIFEEEKEGITFGVSSDSSEEKAENQESKKESEEKFVEHYLDITSIKGLVTQSIVEKVFKHLVLNMDHEQFKPIAKAKADNSKTNTPFTGKKRSLIDDENEKSSPVRRKLNFSEQDLYNKRNRIKKLFAVINIDFPQFNVQNEIEKAQALITSKSGAQIFIYNVFVKKPR